MLTVKVPPVCVKVPTPCAPALERSPTMKLSPFMVSTPVPERLNAPVVALALVVRPSE